MPPRGAASASPTLPPRLPPCVQTALSFAEWLANETAFEAWTPALGHLSNLRGLLFNDTGAPPLLLASPARPRLLHAPSASAGSDGTDLQCVSDLNAYAQALLGPLVAKLGWSGNASEESPLTVLLRSRALSSASLFSLPSVVQGVRGGAGHHGSGGRCLTLFAPRRRSTCSTPALRRSTRTSRWESAWRSACLGAAASTPLFFA